MDKSPDAFRTISEVAELLDTPAHVLRFWESRFPQIKPVKRAGGRRYYRPADVALLSGIRKLLHDEGLTIRGVQKILREQGVRYVSGLTGDDEAQEVELDLAEDNVEEPVVSSAPIPLFPAANPPEPAATEEVAKTQLFASDPEDEEASAAEEEPETEGVSAQVSSDEDNKADEAEGIDEAALLAALNAPLPEPEVLSVTAAPEGEAEPEFSLEEEELQLALNTPAHPSDEAGNEPEAEGHDAGIGGVDIADGEAESDSPQDSAAPEQVAAEESAEQVASAVDEAPADETAADVAGNRVAEDVEPSQPESQPKSAPTPAPGPVIAEISGHWLPADLRALDPGAFGEKRAEVAQLIARLEALRNRVGDLSRTPRR